MSQMIVNLRMSTMDMKRSKARIIGMRVTKIMNMEEIPRADT